ncbi:WG repeat-containing protein [Desulfobacterota bacterium M19]
MDKLIISLDETHHLMNGNPLYTRRFDQVQSFHFPLGFAPVKKARHAFFINQNGERVFNRNFKEAFGFYDGIATVVDEKGFFHIDEQGQDIHSQRFAWSGNFQEGICAVEDMASKQFFHINRSGEPIYTERYSYVGDFRYGIAVVTGKDSLCTHIDEFGNLLHEKYFLELDVYHKSYAIAKDAKGYFHIDKEGYALYHDRYIKLEPYYNGRALAVDQGNIKIIISTTGEVIRILSRLNK